MLLRSPLLLLLVARARAICESPADHGKTPVGLSSKLESSMRGLVDVAILCGDDAALAAARVATHRKTSTTDGEAVLGCAKSLRDLLEQEAASGQIGYLPPQKLSVGQPAERPRELKTGGQYSRRAMEHARKDEFREAIADLLRALLRPNVDSTARDKLMQTLGSFLQKADSKRQEKAQDGDLSDLFDALDMEDDGKDNADLDRSALKRSYRELSVKYHPDKNPGSAARFNRIRDAYEILSDPVKMLLYDTGGQELIKKYEKDGDSEIERVGNTEVDASVSLEEAYAGAEKNVRVHRRVVCRSCRLQPQLARCKKCTRCPGEMGRRQVWMDQWHYRVEEYEIPSDDKCISTADNVKVMIERGVMHGDRVQHPGMGGQLPKKIPGDALVTIKVAKHSTFKRLGNDLMVDVKVSLKEALLGFKRELVHLDGHIVKFGMSKNEVLQPGAGLEIQGEGMPLKEDPSSAGKLIVRFQIDFPSTVPSDAADAVEAALGALPGQSSRPTRIGKAGRSEL